jgi:hypothetical protein
VCGQQVSAVRADPRCSALPDAAGAREQFDVRPDGAGVGIDQEGDEAEGDINDRFKGYEDFVAFVSKTWLIHHYEKILGAHPIGGQRMAIGREAAQVLVNRYLKRNNMGYVKEPKGVDFVVEPHVVTEADKRIISGAIAYYKATGKFKRVPVPKRRRQAAGKRAKR